MFLDGSQENLYRWKILTARHAIVAARHAQNGAEILEAAKEALKECTYDFRTLQKASLRLESVVQKT
ncbi:MAG: hypothetical protein KGH60_04650 [Candidatus Micrarchaeota archaeon]|nr:hypothetical protein [Candidatus Micrarchaeota archaeon]